jgi:hypothetical protein
MHTGSKLTHRSLDGKLYQLAAGDLPLILQNKNGDCYAHVVNLFTIRPCVSWWAPCNKSVTRTSKRESYTDLEFGLVVHAQL